ncbi:MAG: hypothetical protein ACM3VW_07655, partial [Bacteroidota bacterium]
MRSSHGRQYQAGQYTVTELETEQVNSRDSTGRWQPLDISVKHTGASKHEARTDRFSVAFFEDTPTDSVHLDLGQGRTVHMGLDEVPGTYAFQSNGSKALYKHLASATEHEYEVTATSLKETIVIKQDNGKHDFARPLSLEGLDIRPEPDGSFSLLDRGTSSVAAVIPAPFASDAAGALAPGVTQVLENAGGQMMLRVNVDPQWLHAPERRYPVLVDPTIQVSAEATGSATACVGVAGNVCSSTGYAVSWSNTNGTIREWVPLMRFDLSSIPEGAV